MTERRPREFGEGATGTIEVEGVGERIERVACGALLIAASLTAAAVLLGGCLAENPPGLACVGGPPCPPESTCEGADCAGAPVGVAFAAELVAPQGRDNLPTRSEVPVIVFDQAGRATLAFERAVLVTGRVVPFQFEGVSVAARLTFVRRSLIPGREQAIVEANSVAGVGMADISYSVLLPVGDGQTTYYVVVEPGVDNAPIVPGGPSAGAVLPPAHERLELSADRGPVTFDVALGGASYRWVVGLLRNAANEPVSGMRVHATNPRAGDEPARIASNRTLTDALGKYALIVRGDTMVDLIFSPPEGTAMPTLTRSGVAVERPIDSEGTEQQLEPVNLPPFRAAAPFRLAVFGEDSAGGRTPAVGATVFIETELEPDSDDSDVVRFAATAIVDDEGIAELKLIPGTADRNRRYVTRIVSPADSPYSSRVHEDVDVGGGGDGANLLMLDAPLPPRIYVTGTLLDFSGAPVDGASITVHPTGELRSELGAAGYANLQAAGPADVLTQTDGGFFLYVDGDVDGANGKVAYDLRVTPLETSQQPGWTFAGHGLDAEGDGAPAHDLGELTLPDRVLVDVAVVDVSGSAVPGATVHFYERPADECATGNCYAPSLLRARRTTDAAGRATLPLPTF